MKRYSIWMVVLLAIVCFASCEPEKTAGDRMRDQQEVLSKEGVSKVGMPAIVNFREAKTMRMIQELCDQSIVTYSYLENMIPTRVPGYTALGGKLVFLGETIGFPIPYSAQFTAPEAMQTYNISRSTSGGERYYGAERLPQADPNGLHKPVSANATWILMKDPGSENVQPIYIEPNVLAFPFRLPMD